jgi:hypothetical protein
VWLYLTEEIGIKEVAVPIRRISVRGELMTHRKNPHNESYTTQDVWMLNLIRFTRLSNPWGAMHFFPRLQSDSQDHTSLLCWCTKLTIQWEDTGTGQLIHVAWVACRVNHGVLKIAYRTAIVARTRLWSLRLTISTWHSNF